MNATVLQRLHIVFVAVLVLGSFGGWAISFLDQDNASDLMWTISALSWFGSSLFLVVLGHAIERATVIRGPSWVFWGILSCLPILRVFVEVSMVTSMARIAGDFVEDMRVETRARRLMIARVLVVVAQYAFPVLLIWTMEATNSGYCALNWLFLSVAISVVSVMLLAVATHIVVAPVVEALREAEHAKVGGAGAQESVAVRTL